MTCLLRVMCGVLFVTCYVWCPKVLSCNLSCMKVMSCYLCLYYTILVKENCVHICVQFFFGGGGGLCVNLFGIFR